MKRLLLLVSISVCIFSCKNNEQKEVPEDNMENISTEEPKKDSEWTFLFNGDDADGWRGYNETDGSGLPEGWVVENGTLKSLGKGGDIGGDIIYAGEKYGDFELALEWKLSSQGNSGVFYHIVEDEKYEAPYFTGPEYQIIDSDNFPQELETWQKIGADYGMYVPNYDELDLKDVTEWNTSRIRVTENKVTYWLNGQKTVEFDPNSEEWTKRKEEGKWKDYPDYGEAKTGYIGLQDHGSEIWFRNIKIKEL